MISIQEVPSSNLVQKGHLDDGTKKAQKPKQSAGATEAQIEKAKGRKQERRKRECR
jgi:hypothetical protein